MFFFSPGHTSAVEEPEDHEENPTDHGENGASGVDPILRSMAFADLKNATNCLVVLHMIVVIHGYPILGINPCS